MSDYYPPWGFYYRVEFGISKNKNDVRFQTVSGLSVEYDMEEYKEGGRTASPTSCRCAPSTPIWS